MHRFTALRGVPLFRGKYLLARGRHGNFNPDGLKWLIRALVCCYGVQKREGTCRVPLDSVFLDNPHGKAKGKVEDPAGVMVGGARMGG